MDTKTKPQSTSPASSSRRRFMQLSGAAGGGLLFGFSLFGCQKKEEPRNKPPSERAVGQATSANSDQPPGLARDAFIRIDRDGLVTFICPKVEMGQGTFTAIPMLLAEELGADLSKVKLEQAPASNALYADPLLGGQVTGGSTSVRGAWTPLRQAGATVRAVLVTAAAKQWNTDPGSVKVIDGRIMHPDGKQSLGFGDVADAASKLPLPGKVELKPASAFTLIGKPHHRLDSPIKANGQAQFGLDARLPNMGIAAVAIAPVTGGKLASADEQKAMAVKGVRQVVKLENAVAVIGDHFWAARQGLEAAAPTWDDGPNANVTSASIVADMMKASQSNGAVATNKGDALKRLGDKNGRRIDAIYEVPFLAHATMEPMNCTVDLKADGCDIYCGTQVPALAQAAAAKITGLPQEKVRVHNHYLGGGFGRRLEVDYVAQAVAIAKASGKGPVKLVW
ncbi:MAG: molybdopterin cofactor-binding domain-containing protein, partial [Telluria sp.]